MAATLQDLVQRGTTRVRKVSAKAKTRTRAKGSCGGNHFSRECPKGDGNGAKGGGKNSGKAMKCFNCGGFGHHAAQCPTSVREIEYDDEEEGVESVSEGWDIFGLEEGRRQQRRHHQYGCSGQCQRPRPAQGDFQLHLKSRDPGVNSTNQKARPLGTRCRAKSDDQKPF